MQADGELPGRVKIRSRPSPEQVEMLFAHIKRNLGFTRLKLRGLAGAAKEFLLVATVQNLRRLVRLRLPDIAKTRPAPA
jgi:hypothetical protein